MKCRRLAWPTQLFRNMQWWSMSVTHVLQRLRCSHTLRLSTAAHGSAAHWALVLLHLQ